MNKWEKVNYIIELLNKNSIEHVSTYLNKSVHDIEKIIELSNQKICPNVDCIHDGKIQHINNFYKNKGRTRGVDSFCKDCVRIINKRNKTQKIVVTRKFCKSCEIEKEINQFHKDKTSNDGHQHYCIDCRKKYLESFAKFDKFSDQLIEDIQRDPKDNQILQVKCVTCNNWFNPTIGQTRSRINAINGNTNNIGVQNNFYCSDQCKNSCSIFRMRNNYRPLQKQLRNLKLLEYQDCIKCGSIDSLIAHHIDPVVNNPIESADLDNIVLVCSDCHTVIHQQPGCTFQELKCV